MKKILFALGVLVLVVLIGYRILPREKQNAEIVFSNTTHSSSYAEYPFDSGDDRDLGFTKRAYAQLQKTQTLFDAGSSVIEMDEMTYAPLSEQELGKGILERRTWGDDVYELTQTFSGDLLGVYAMQVNGQLLFKAQMDFGSSGPIQDWRIIDGKPAFTFRSHCDTDESNQGSCDQDIWYDGSLLSKKFGVKNPRSLFSYNDKIGFIASHDGADAVFYDGKFITPGFETIWTHNCCSYTEILPTVYQNGTLLFYAIREGNYLVETRLN